MSDGDSGTKYRAVCHSCGWESDGARYRDKPYQSRRHAKRATSGHISDECPASEVEVVAVDD